MPKLSHAGAAVLTELVSAIDNDDLSFSIADPTGWVFSDAFVVVVDRGFSNEEKILCASISGSTISVLNRGWDGTLPRTHLAGATILHVFTATEADEASAHVYGSLDHSTAQPIEVRHASASITRKAIRFNDGPTVEAALLDDAGANEVEVTLHSKTFVHQQVVPSAEWVIDHNLGGYPSVRVLDSAGGVIWADPQYPSSNRVVLPWSASFAGIAYLSN